ncbi:hypothetical protein HZH68_015463 [Vespula germanica]|uniref:Uncharacterized protein n=1 Tax=Vespula germanica TaxID=30212 RepID=A0A834J8U3_VESGE|nr:hypothetical protein HZH68_015463 [Vespula germanica]
MQKIHFLRDWLLMIRHGFFMRILQVNDFGPFNDNKIWSSLEESFDQTIEFLERLYYAERWRKYKGTTKDTTVIESESNKKLVKFSLTRSNYTEKQHSFEILIIWEIGQKLVKYWFEDVFFPEVERPLKNPAEKISPEDPFRDLSWCYEKSSMDENLHMDMPEGSI